MNVRTDMTGVLLAALLLLPSYACTGNQSSPVAAPKPQKQAVAKVAASKVAASKVESRVPKVTGLPSGSIKITGSQNGTVSVPAKRGGYLIKFRYKGLGLKLETDSPLGALNMIPGGQVVGADGWTAFEDLTSFTEDGERIYRIAATEPFEIELQPLPLAVRADLVPQTYTGSGLKVLGPLSLKAGFALFKVGCPDLKQAGFIAELYDARTAQNKGVIALGTGSKVAETKKLKLAGAGDYLLKVNANGRSEWTIEVTQ